MPSGRSLLSCLCITLALTAPMRAVEAADGGPDPIVVQDPHFGDVLFHFYQEDYFPAIVRVLAAKEQQKLDNHADDAELLLGGMYLSFGHHLEAAEIFERLLADNVSPGVRDRTWFFLAKIWYQRGYLDKSQEALSFIQGALPDNLEREALMLDAQILIDAGNYDAAIVKLADWQGETEWASYAKFNVGVALVRSGRVDDASELLDELGQLNPFNEEMAALRDKANLALGYALLQDGQALAAKAPLQRVRLEGPFSNKALLGVGWADVEMGNFQRALVPWMELRSRDLLDPAVQESMLAIPYAMAKLDSVSQAADHYLNAVEAYYEETNRLEQTIQQIESGRFFDNLLENKTLDGTGWYWQLEELPGGPEARYLFHLLAKHEFQEGLKNFRDLTYLYRNLDDWQQNVGVYANMLETRREAYASRLPRIQDALARADVEELIRRKLEFDSRLNNIEESGDWLALASTSEFDMWGEISGLESTPALEAEIPEAWEVQDKIDLLKGVLQWRLDREFNERLWRVRRDVRQTGEALVATQRLRRQIDESMRQEPMLFESLGNRVDDLGPRIEGTKMRVEDAISTQRAYLQTIAIGELRAQKQRLDVYSAQARFALAAIYDVAATGEEPTE